MKNNNINGIQNNAAYVGSHQNDQTSHKHDPTPVNASSSNTGGQISQSNNKNIQQHNGNSNGQFGSNNSSGATSKPIDVEKMATQLSHGDANLKKQLIDLSKTNDNWYKLHTINVNGENVSVSEQESNAHYQKRLDAANQQANAHPTNWGKEVVRFMNGTKGLTTQNLNDIEKYINTGNRGNLTDAQITDAQTMKDIAMGGVGGG